MPTPPAPDVRFEQLASDFLAQYLVLNPVHATELGDHRYDGNWPAVDAEGLARHRAFISEFRARLAGIPQDSLSPQNRVDAAILANRLALGAFTLDELRPLQTDPLGYAQLIGDGLDPLVTRSFAPLAERMESLRLRLAGIAVLVAAAKQNLENPPKIHTETAIQQVHGLISLVEEQLPVEFAKVPHKKADLEAAAKNASRALRDFEIFLRDDLLSRSDGDFRVGPTRFERKLGFVLHDDVDPDALHRDARTLLSKTRDDMVVTATALWKERHPMRPVPPTTSEAQKNRFLRSVLDEVASDHPSNDTIVDEARKLTRDATEFVRKHDIVRVPDEPIEVIEMPEYRRGIAVAYCDSAGPLEQKRETFFAISPTPASWTKKRAESFYREYNRAMLGDLTVHEAMPGHFLQIAHANQFEGKVRSIFYSGPFVEGWAVYSEWVMSELGFGGLATRLQRQKMVLRLAANAILDHELHAGSMDEKAAMDLMMNQAFQEEGEAAGKWRRAKLTSAQLTTYFYGFTRMMAIRQRAEQQPGFSLRAFHDKLLSSGSPPPRYIGFLIFGDPFTPTR